MRGGILNRRNVLAFRATWIRRPERVRDTHGIIYRTRLRRCDCKDVSTLFDIFSLFFVYRFFLFSNNLCKFIFLFLCRFFFFFPFLSFRVYIFIFVYILFLTITIEIAHVNTVYMCS